MNIRNRGSKNSYFSDLNNEIKRGVLQQVLGLVPALPRVRLPLFLFAIFFLSGCASCNTVTFIKVTPQNVQEGYKVETSQFNTSVEFDKLKFGVFSAGCSHKLCASIRPAAGTKVRFDQDSLEVSRLNGSEVRSYKINPIHYSWICFKSNGEDKVCTMEDKTPTGKPTKVIDDEVNIVGNDIMVTDSHTRSFEPTEEFIGQVLYMPSMFGNKPTPKDVHTFSVTLVDEYLLNTPIKMITLPKISIDDVQYTLPNFKLETVSEEFCHFPK